MFASAMIRLPTVSTAETSRYTGHGSSSVQLMPAHSMSSSVHWNGTSIGLPVFRSTGSPGSSVFGGSVFGSSIGGAMGACAHVACTRNRTAATASLMLRTILAQPVGCSIVTGRCVPSGNPACESKDLSGKCRRAVQKWDRMDHAQQTLVRRYVTVSDPHLVVCVCGTGGTTTRNVLLKNRCRTGRQKKNETKPMDHSSYI